MNGLEPQAYITDAITKIAADWPASRWDELMPWKWQPPIDQPIAEAARPAPRRPRLQRAGINAGKGARTPEQPTPKSPGSEAADVTYSGCVGFFGWLRELDLNQRPSGYEPDELPGCSIPR